MGITRITVERNFVLTAVLEDPQNYVSLLGEIDIDHFLIEDTKIKASIDNKILELLLIYFRNYKTLKSRLGGGATTSRESQLMRIDGGNFKEDEEIKEKSNEQV